MTRRQSPLLRPEDARCERLGGERRLALVQRLELAKQSAELPPDFQSAISAQVLVTFLQGFFRVARTLHSRAQLEAQLEVLLKGLGL
jgi:hypothetical protein